MNDAEAELLEADGAGLGLGLDAVMEHDQVLGPGAAAEALQPEDQQHPGAGPEVEGHEMMEDMRSPPAQPGPAQLPAGRGLLLRHASQSSLDESSQKLGHKLGEQKRPPYRNTAHSGKALEGMNSMRLAGLLCDVTLVADITEIPAHKVTQNTELRGRSAQV